MSIAIPDVKAVADEIKRTKARLQALCHLKKAAERQEQTRSITSGQSEVDDNAAPVVVAADVGHDDATR